MNGQRLSFWKSINWPCYLFSQWNLDKLFSLPELPFRWRYRTNVKGQQKGFYRFGDEQKASSYFIRFTISMRRARSFIFTQNVFFYNHKVIQMSSAVHVKILSTTLGCNFSCHKWETFSFAFFFMSEAMGRLFSPKNGVDALFLTGLSFQQLPS